MRIEAALSRDEIEAFLVSLFPMKIKLQDSGELILLNTEAVSVVADVGVRVACQARLHWTLAGIAVPATVHALTLLLVPFIAERNERDALVFRVQVEHADFSGLPHFVDNKVKDLVNSAMTEKQVELSWDFLGALSHSFELPDSIENVQSIGLAARNGKVTLGDGSLALTVQFDSVVQRRAPQEVADAG